MKNISSFKTDSFGQKQPRSSAYRRRGTQGNEYGSWVRYGSTVVVHLPENLPEKIQFEFELDREAALPTLRSGSRGSAVQTLQTRLKARGYDPGFIDGIFGSRTDAAVKAFQRASGITVDGIVGPQTWSALAAEPLSPQPNPASGGDYARRAIHLSVPFYGYRENDKVGCFRRCTEMAAAVGVTVGGPDVRIQVAVGEDNMGRVTVDPAKVREGRAYIDAELERKRPVVVGVSYMNDDYNVDEITDHFVIITTRNTDPARGMYYAYHDPGSSSESKGGDQSIANRFLVSSNGNLYRPVPSINAPLAGKIYDVSMVRRNV